MNDGDFSFVNANVNDAMHLHQELGRYPEQNLGVYPISRSGAFRIQKPSTASDEPD